MTDTDATVQAPARVLGPFSAACVVVGAIIGVGIFFSPSRVAAAAGTGHLALLTWGIAGVVALCGALCFAELGGRYASSGAQYDVLRDAYGPLPAFMFVFCNATAIQAGSIGIIAVVCARNIAVAAGVSIDGRAELLAATALIAGVTAANALGAAWGSRIQNVTVVAKVATLAAVTVLAMLARPDAGPPGEPLHAASDGLGMTAGVLAAMVPTLFAFGGWQQALWVAGEVRDPARTLPRAIVGGVLVVIVVYLAANWAYLHLLGVRGVAGSKALAADAVGVVLPGTGRRLVAAAVASSAFGVLNCQLLTGPRLVYGMARDGRFFAIFSTVHPRSRTPIAAIVLLTVVALVLLWAAGFGGVDQLLNGVVFIDGVFFALTGAAVVVLRRRNRTDAGHAFRTPWYPFVPIVFVVGELGVVVGAYVDPAVRRAAVIGLCWIAAAALLFAVRFRSSTRRPDHA